MAHFALVNDGVVRNVVTIANAAINNLPFPESEPVGQAFIATLPDLAVEVGVWWQCSYNANFRGCYPAVRFGFNGVDFIPPGEPALTADDYTTQTEPVIEAP